MYVLIHNKIQKELDFMEEISKKWPLFFAVALGPFMIGIDFLAFGVALEPMAKEFNTNLSVLQWFISAFAIGNSSFLLLSGKLIDYFTDSKVFIYGLCIFMISSLMICLNHSIIMVIFSRFLQGMSGGILSTASTAILVNRFSPNERPIWLGRLIATVGIGMALGPSVGGILIHKFDWRMLFLINIPIGCISLFLSILFTFPSSQKNTNVIFNYYRISLFFISISLITFLISQAQQLSLNNAIIIFSISIFCLTLLFYLERYKNPSLLNFDIFRSKNFLIGSMIAFILYFTTISWLLLYSLYLEQIAGYSPVKVGLMLSPFGMAMIMGSFFVTKFKKIRCKSNKIMIGIICTIFSYIILFINVKITYLSGLLLFSLLGFGFAVTNATSLAATLEFIPKPLIGLASGKTMTMRWLGAALGSSICSMLFSVISKHRFLINHNFISSYIYSLSICLLILSGISLLSLIITFRFFSKDLIIYEEAK